MSDTLGPFSAVTTLWHMCKPRVNDAWAVLDAAAKTAAEVGDPRAEELEEAARLAGRAQTLVWKADRHREALRK